VLLEDRLDALLSNKDGSDPWLLPPADELAPLVMAAHRLDTLRTATPRAAFGDALHARLLAHAATLQTTEQMSQGNGAVVGATTVTRTRTLPWAERLRRREAGSGPRRRFRSPLWRVAAAAVLLIFVGGGLLAAAASAAPGSPLYGLRRWEQDTRASLASPADRVRLHLGYAKDALHAYDGIVSHHAGDPAYSDALATLIAEEQAAARDLASVPAGGEHDDLARQLSALHQQTRADLHSALSQIGWEDRVSTTSALAALGEQVLVVASAHIRRDDGGSGHGTIAWRIEVHGSGFADGAIVMLDGRQVGVVVVVTPALVVAVVQGADPPSGAMIGIQNPDGTAAQTSNIQRDASKGPEATPEDTMTPGGSHGGGRPTPTPSTTPGNGGHGGQS
jgi:hypothetical protein